MKFRRVIVFLSIPAFQILECVATFFVAVSGRTQIQIISRMIMEGAFRESGLARRVGNDEILLENGLYYSLKSLIIEKSFA